MSHTRAVWDEGREPGRAVVALGVAVALTVIVAHDLVTPYPLPSWAKPEIMP